MKNVYLTLLVLFLSARLFAQTPITGPTIVCPGATITLSNATPGGTWSSAATSTATINSTTGVVTGISAGTVLIDYTTSTWAAGYNVTVTTLSAVPPITGPSAVMLGYTITLSDAAVGGSWSSSATPIASVGSASGVVTGVATGTAIINYTYPGCAGTVTATDTVHVVPVNILSGSVYFDSTFAGTVKLWLITYDPSTFMLQAVDSVSVACSLSAVAPYQFLMEPTDSYLVKAAVTGSFSSRSYLPTYDSSNFYWYGAHSINHTVSIIDTGNNIYMIRGVPGSGPGFISGSVLTGANKGTAGGVPVAGLRMNIGNAATSQLLQTVYTDATGAYRFSNLPTGQSYFIFPDSLNYLTTPITSLTLTASASGFSGADFVQHTLSHTITPSIAFVPAVPASAVTIALSPNPSRGIIHIRWSAPATAAGSMTVTDVGGNTVYQSTLTLLQGSGDTQADLSALPDGIYVVHISTGDVHYSTKLQLAH